MRTTEYVNGHAHAAAEELRRTQKKLNRWLFIAALSSLLSWMAAAASFGCVLVLWRWLR